MLILAVEQDVLLLLLAEQVVEEALAFRLSVVAAM